jgi:hypothetical protein
MATGEPPSFKSHTTALVPLETWSYHSPRLAIAGKRVDVGGLAEALIYYENVFANVQRTSDLEFIVGRFAQDRALDSFRSLVASGNLRIFNFAFDSMPFENEGLHGLANFQGEDQIEPGWIDRGIVNRLPLDRWVTKSRHRKSIIQGIRANAIEVKAKEFGVAIDNALHDLEEPRRAALLVQALMDDVHDLLPDGKRPEVTAEVTSGPKGRTTVKWSVDLKAIGLEIKDYRLDAHTPVAAAVQSNRLVWAAARHNLDLFSGPSLSRLIGDKLFEIASRGTRTQDVLEQLETEVEFPDVRSLVNSGRLPLSEVVRIRAKAGRFRTWLQDEAERDRNAIIAYHHEVAKESGLTKMGRKVLRFANVGSGAIGTLTGTAVTTATGEPSLGLLAGAAVGKGTSFLLESLAKMGEGWRPVTFGEWAKTRIKKYLDETS